MKSEAYEELHFFRQIGLAADQVTLRLAAQLKLGEEQKKKRHRDRQADADNEQHGPTSEKDIQRRLTELREMERLLAQAPKRQ